MTDFLFFFTSGAEKDLTFHDGTIRDLVFMQDSHNQSSLLISAGAGDCKIYVTDCETGHPIRVTTGHTGMLAYTINMLMNVKAEVEDSCMFILVNSVV